MISKKLWAMLSASLVISTVSAAYAPDKITEMPNITFKTDTYSGYLNVTNTTKFLHYTLTMSMDKPDTDPTLVWFNGGPGCSSMLGMFQENGPFTIDTEGLGIIAENPHPWNARANVIYLEQPVGVGFSFGNATTDYIHSDMS